MALRLDVDSSQDAQGIQIIPYQEKDKRIQEYDQAEEVIQNEEKFSKPDAVTRLTAKQRFCFSIGHIQNDLQAYAAFSYLLVFWTKVIGLSNSSTGIIFLVAQVTDGILSPAIGYACDRYDFPLLSRFGKRKAWHMFGTIVLLIFSPFLFVRCLLCEVTSGDNYETVAITYYSMIVIAIHFGFAAVQISHLALLPDIAKKPNDFVRLNSSRTTWTFISGMFVYAVTWLLLGESSGEKLSSKQWKEFMYLGFIIIAVGFSFTVVFYIGVNENRIKNSKGSTRTAKVKESRCNIGYREDETNPSKVEVKNETDDTQATEVIARNDVKEVADFNQDLINNDNKNTPQRTIADADSTPIGNIKITNWFKTSEFYMVAFIYMCSRVVVNISNSYFPLYLVDALGFEKEAIAYFPLLVLISSALFSIVARKISSRWGTKVAYSVAALMAITAFLWLHLQPIDSKNAIYGTSMLMGGGASMMLITALTMTSVMINRVDKATGAFVYGVMGFTDKVVNGAIVAVIQNYYPRAQGCSGCGEYIRVAFPLVTGSSALLSLVALLVHHWKSSHRKVDDSKTKAPSIDNQISVIEAQNSNDTRL
ncbi:major facilitator superfamily domain-containing protein 12-like [Actinia tenebrosa]|uniref:Major facilitator superfamily domain-containing protein 12-like n=1 Tax=Actinia tenebrosa TaxID=6105 RepID=A0A6P8H0Z6_ACTTE|nr:major facilitator superfamily domain-containing protein 12-like [Actinia tenebrosa]